jgi:copper chaperone
MTEKELKVSGMSCNHCVMAIKKELASLPLESYDVRIGSVKLIFDENKLTIEKIETAIQEAGYQVIK